MPTNLWREFANLLPGRARILATVVVHNADGTSSLVTADGKSMRAWGQLELVPPYNAFVRDGKVEASAPNLALLQLELAMPAASGFDYYTDALGENYTDATGVPYYKGS